MTTPTLDRDRLQAALASLNLSLESELTQFRCHRLVQSHRPLETPEPSSMVLPTPDSSEATDPVAVNPMATAAASAPLSLVPDAAANLNEPDELNDFDPAELMGLLPQSYATPEPEAPATHSTTKRPFASTRELLKQARQNHRPWFQQQVADTPQHRVQRWLIVMGILAGMGGGILFWLSREQPVAEVATEAPAESSPIPAPPSGPNMAARQFPEVNRSTLPQLEPDSSAERSSPEPSEVTASPEPSTPEVFVEQAADRRYYVLAPYRAAADLAKVQEIVPDAFLVGSGDETKIQLGMFVDEASAQGMVNQLRDRL